MIFSRVSSVSVYHLWQFQTYIFAYNKENHKGVNEIKNKPPKRYSQPSSRGHREYRVRMTFLVSVSIKLKKQTCPRRH